MASDVVIDISHHQPDPIDWARVKAAGIVGVIHKATEGTSYVDDKLFSRAKAAMAAGLRWSTYHFLRPGSLQAQMDFYLETIDPVEGERVCLDHEDSGVSVENLKDCVEYIRSKRPDLQITIYSGHLIEEQLGNRVDPLLATTSLWTAEYGDPTPEWATGTWPQWTLFQYTDSGHVDGISGNVDRNQFNGSPENCALWFGPAGSQPAPEPEPEPEPDTVLVVDVPPGTSEVRLRLPQSSLAVAVAAPALGQ